MRYIFWLAPFLALAMAACDEFPCCHRPGDLCRIGSGTPGDGKCCHGKTCVKKSGSENWYCR
ncbi:hypothetical protein PENCOP_c009G00911 [Penicillium coprophilum]|uniref:Uncharacterized protein n=1 Tax=Penicillium coprophilum TaxID=36646 RepID=A0A1V6UH04_9EURO|nr:hypothetical protein PENCOP_c009G00911 [Penicillium coprophilum]